MLVISEPILASAQADFELIGFSPDGTFAAWEMTGVQDGSGFHWVEFEVIDTGTSLRVDGFSHVWTHIDGLPEEEKVSAVRDSINRICTEFEIQQDAAIDLLVYHPLTDISVSPDTVHFCTDVYSPDYRSSRMTLVLEYSPADIDQYYPDWFPPPVTPDLSLICGEEAVSFFSETIIPEACRVNYDYGIAAVYRNPIVENSLLVVLHTRQPGFEGSDGKFRVVSGEYENIDRY